MKLKIGPAATMRVFPTAIDERRPRFCLRGQRFMFVFAEELDVATERNNRKEVFGFTDLSSEDLGPGSRGKTSAP